MNITAKRALRRLKRRKRVRGKISGTEERPRLTVSKSLKHIYAQVIDDEKMVTLASASTLAKDIVGELSDINKTDAAAKVGELVAKISLDKGIKRVAFDRNGYRFHGRIKALADGARKGGLEF